MSTNPEIDRLVALMRQENRKLMEDIDRQVAARMAEQSLRNRLKRLIDRIRRRKAG